MFDFSKLSDMAKLAQEAKNLQKKQEEMQKQQIDLLKKISGQLEEIISLLKSNKV